MKKIILLFAIAVVVVSACKPGSNVEKERANIIELRNQLYDQNSVLSSQKVAEEAIEAFRAFGKNFPEDSLAMPYHIEAGEIAWTLAQYPLSIEIFQEILGIHPESDMVPYLYLRLGSIYNDAMKDTINAKKYYMLLLENYPQSEFSEGAQFGLETLGMSEKEQFDHLMEKAGQPVESAGGVEETVE
ncbi:MAG: tetratricopeptide repeat protein [Bacteroidales bacterium]